MSTSETLYQARTLERVENLQTLTRELFAGKTACTLELGCGHGHFLTAYAGAHPEEYCVGIDLITKRVEKANTKAQRQGLYNLRFAKAEAVEFLHALPPGLCFTRIFMLFPDPWPKKRHHKNRMVQDNLLGLLADRSTAETTFYFRTDHRDYFDWTRRRLEAHPRWRLAPELPWYFEEPTYFQGLMESWQSLVAQCCGPALEGTPP